MKPPVVSEDDLALHYSEGFSDWNCDFLVRIRTKPTGFTLLQGPPGTGKTTYLRYLMLRLKRSHIFYYVPISAYPLLAAPGAVDFWLGENDNTDKTRVAILEDAEPLLMKRATDNHDCVSNLLNICDGFLGDLLKLHVICTINCSIDALDPALMRAGRLLAYREFQRLTPVEAQKLTAMKKLNIAKQESYSLAKIYNEPSVAPLNGDRHRVGFRPFTPDQT